MQNHKYSEIEEQWLLDNHGFYDTLQLLTSSFNEMFNTHLSREAIRQHCVKNLGLMFRSPRHTYSESEIDWIMKNFWNYETTKDLANEFNRIHGAVVSRQNLGKKCKELGLVRGNCTPYTSEQNDWLKRFANTVPYSQLAVLFNQKFAKQVTSGALRQHCESIGIYSENQYQFGNKSAWNKAELLTERVDSRGNVVIKISDLEHGWVNKARYVYEQALGKIPKDHQVVFLDGNRHNFELSNLYCIPVQYMLMMNRNHWFTTNRNLTLTAIKLCELNYASKANEMT